MVAAAHLDSPIEFYSPRSPTHSQPLDESKNTKLLFKTWELIVPSDLASLKEHHLHGALSPVSHIKNTWSTDMLYTSRTPGSHAYRPVLVSSGAQDPGSCTASLQGSGTHKHEDMSSITSEKHNSCACLSQPVTPRTRLPF